MMHRPEEGRERWRSVRARESGQEEKKNEYILTGEELKDARDGEPLSFGEGEELSHEHEDSQDGEYTSEDRAGLHCLEVICRGSQREDALCVSVCVCDVQRY